MCTQKFVDSDSNRCVVIMHTSKGSGLLGKYLQGAIFLGLCKKSGESQLNRFPVTG